MSSSARPILAYVSNRESRHDFLGVFSRLMLGLECPLVKGLADMILDGTKARFCEGLRMPAP